VEKKSKEIPSVAASEGGIAQTKVFDFGVVGSVNNVQKFLAEHFWKVRRYKVIAL
jgi:hypothetical protein